MAPPEIIEQKSASKRRPRRKRPKTPPSWFSIASFCISHHISESFYHRLKGLGRGPRETVVGARIFIRLEDAAAWRDEQARVAASAAE